MKVIKKILAGLGILFIVLLALAALLAKLSSDFLEDNRAFVADFTRDLSKRWNVADVHERVSNEFLQTLDTAQGHEGFRQLRSLGALKDMGDLEMGNYNAATNGTTAEISYKATFENAKGLVKITLIKKDGKVQVQGFFVSLPDGIQITAKENEA